MDKAKIYDYNGPIIDIEPFWEFLRKNNPELYHQYRIAGDKEKEVKQKTKPLVLEIHEDAIQRGLIPPRLMPYVRERLECDAREGYHPFIFTTAPKNLVLEQLKETGIDIYFQSPQIITLDEVIASASLDPKTTKEDPLAFAALIKHLSSSFSLETYVDDSEKRILAAHEANQSFPNLQRIGRLYVFDPKCKKESNKVYTRVNSMMDVK